MIRKIIKYLSWFVVILLGISLLLSAMIYLPPVQDFVKNKVSQAVEENSDMRLDVGRIRLKFPLTIDVRDLVFTTKQQDTLASLKQLNLRVAVWPLLMKELRATQLIVDGLAINYVDSLAPINIKGEIGSLMLNRVGVKLNENEVGISSFSLSKADVDIVILENEEKVDTTETQPALWKIALNSGKLDEVAFKMTMADPTELNVELAKGRINRLNIDLGKQYVAVRSILLDGGLYSYLSDPMPETDVLEQSLKEMEIKDTTLVTQELPWTIQLDNLSLQHNSVRFGTLTGVPAKGFDPNHIAIAELNMEVDSIFNKGSEVRAIIRRLEMNERSGLSIKETKGKVWLDAMGMGVEGFELHTANSKIVISATAGEGILDMDPAAPIAADISATISPADWFLLQSPSAAIRKAFGNKSLIIKGNAAGTLGAIDLSELSVNVTRHISLNTRGSLRSITDPKKMSANVNLWGSFTNLEFVKELIPDTLMQKKIGFPEKIGVKGNIAIIGERYIPKITITADTAGYLKLDADVNLVNEVYDAALKAENFPLHSFLPHDSLGLLSLDLIAKGKGFNPEKETASANVDLKINRFDFKGFDHNNISLVADLKESVLSGKLLGNNEALKLNVDIDGEIHPKDYAVGLSGDLTEVDLQMMRFSETPLALSTVMNVNARAHLDSLYKGDFSLNKIKLTHGIRVEQLDEIVANASADNSAVKAQLRSGDLTLSVNIPVGLDSLSNAIALTMEEVNRQIEARDIDMELIQPLLPPLRVDMLVSSQNPIRTFARGNGVDFRRIRATLSSGEDPLKGWVVVNGLKSGGVTLDTLHVGLGSNNHSLDYFLRLANRPGNLEQLALFYIYGGVLGDKANMNFLQRNREGNTGFRLGFEAQLRDSSVFATMSPEQPTIAYEKWNLNPQNYVEYFFNKEIYADLEMSSGNQSIEIKSVDHELMPKGSVRLNLNNIELAQMLDMIPLPPPIEGVLNARGLLGMESDFIVGDFRAGVNEFKYDRQLVGDISASFTAAVDSVGVIKMRTRLNADSVNVFSLNGTYDEKLATQPEQLDIKAEIKDLPLSLLNPFLPSQTATLKGVLKGGFTISGAMEKPNAGGQMNFDNASVNIAMIGTTYRLSSEPIVFEDFQLKFNKFGVISPNNKLLALDGKVDMRNISRPYTDLQLSAKDFRIIDSSRSGGSQVYGKAAMDFNAKLHGPIDAMMLRGDVRLLNSTDITYTLRDSPLDVEDKEQKIVTFVSFDELDQEEPMDSVALMRVWGMDMLVNVTIDDNVEVALHLSESGNNRIELVGGGALAFTMNSQGDTRLSGRYSLTGGTVVYNPPIISAKNFKISDGSYMEWTGDLLNPSFNITAVERLNTTVTTASGTGQAVFDVSIIIANTLENMAIRFDLSSTGELQTDIASLTAEERSTQAMSLLLYNTYTGPGVTGKVDANNPLNDFIAKELNQWARNNLKGVDISVGISSVDDAYGGTHTDYSYKVSKKLFSDRVTVTIGGSVSDDKSPDKTKDSFIEDVSVEYRISKRDNMFLKAYRYNTQESILEGEVIETGGGFVVRKKMNNLKELFRLTPNPDKRKRRQEERELKKLEKKLEKEVRRERNRLKVTQDEE